MHRDRVTAFIDGSAAILAKPTTAAIGVTVAISALFVALLSSYFQADDFLNIAQSRERGLSWSWLNSPLFGHWLPARRLLDWGLAVSQPIAWEATLGVIVLIVGITALLVRLVVLQLTASAAWAAVAAIAVPLAGAISGTVQWYAGAAQVIPSLMFATALQLGCLWLMRVRGWSAILILGAIAAALGVGLLFDERIAVLAIAAPLVAALAVGTRPRLARLALPYAVIVPTLGAWYLVQDRITDSSLSYSNINIGESLQYLLGAIPGAVLPGIIGWISRPALGGVTLLMIVGAITGVVLLALAVITGRRERLALILLITAAILIHLPVAVVRAAQFGASSSLESRYSAMVMPLAIALAVVIAQGGVRVLRRLSAGRVAVVSAAVLIAISVTVNLVHLSASNTGRPVREWTMKLTAGIEALGNQPFYNAPVDQLVIARAFYPYNMTSSVIPLMVNDTTTRVTSSRALLVRQNGSVEWATVGDQVVLDRARAEDLAEPAEGCWSASDVPGRLWYALPSAESAEDVRVITVEGSFPSEDVRVLTGVTSDQLYDKTSWIGGHPPSVDSSLWVTTDDTAGSRVLVVELAPGASICIEAVTIGVLPSIFMDRD